MITLDYYDDNTVRDNAVFFTWKKIFAICIASYLLFGFSIYKLVKIEIEKNTQIAQICFFVAILVISLITIIICDFDKVNITNINRQIISNLNNIGKYKTDCFKDYINSINKLNNL